MVSTCAACAAETPIARVVSTLWPQKKHKAADDPTGLGGIYSRSFKITILNINPLDILHDLLPMGCHQEGSDYHGVS